MIEDDTRNISFGAGYSTSEGIVGDIAVSERNLFGNGQALRVKLTGSTMRFQAELGFTEPRLFGSNYAGGFDVFYKDTDYTTQSSFKSQRVGGDLRLGYQISDEWSGSVNYTFSRNTIYDVGPNASAAIKEAVPGFPNVSSNTYHASSVGYSLAYDTRNNKRRPTEGIYYTLSQDLSLRWRRRALSAVGGRRPRLLPRVRYNYGGGSRHGRRDRRLGRPGCTPPRSVHPGARACVALPFPVSDRAIS